MLARIYRRGVADERGAILLLMAIALPVIVLLLAMSMDFGNWYVKKRQLETRVKAGALAAGVAYTTEFAKCASPATRPAAEAAIVLAAKRFAGEPNTAGALNTKASDATDQLSIAVNDGRDDPCTDNTGDGFPSPDGGYWTDVSAVAAEVPSFFAGFGVPKPKITASARVALMEADGGMRPFAVADCVSATFVNSGQPPVDLQQVDATTWQAAIPFGMPGSNVILASVTVGCGGNNTTYPGMAFVRRVGVEPSPTLQDIELVPTAPCTNPYFIRRDGSSCGFNVRATVTFSGPHPTPVVRAQLDTGAFVPLTRQGTSDVYVGGAFSVAPQSGAALPNGLRSIRVAASPTGAPGSFTTFPSDAARVQAGAAADQGPIADVTLTDHALATGSSMGTLTVELRAGAAADESKRLIDGGVNCGSGTLASSFVNGCAGPFTTVTGSACSQTASQGGDFPPFDCVGGVASNALATLSGGAYNALWAPGGTCTSNRYSQHPTPGLPPGDPRLISVFLTDAIPATQNSSQTYKITGFAAFYVTGWSNAPSACANETPPPGATSGSVWGHVVPGYVLASTEGTASDTPCPGPPTLCIATLVK